MGASHSDGMGACHSQMPWGVSRGPNAGAACPRAVGWCVCYIKPPWIHMPRYVRVCRCWLSCMGSSCVVMEHEGSWTLAGRCCRWQPHKRAGGCSACLLRSTQLVCTMYAMYMGCAIPMASLLVLVDVTFGAHVLHPLGPNICARPSWCAGEVCIPTTLTVLTVPSPPSHLSCLSNPIPPPVFPHLHPMPVIRPVLALT
jgi:hypothetical protein